jgi:Putative beta-barrel porin-2, OmpL-like. bbp2
MPPVGFERRSHSLKLEDRSMNRFGGFVTLVAIAAATAGGNPLAAQAPPDSAKNAGADSAKAAAPAPAAPAGPKVNISGFVTASYTYSTRHTGGAGSPIVGRLYDRFHDQIELNAAKLTLDKPVATDKWDAGAHVDLLFGQNPAVIQSAGLNLGTNGDIEQAYATVNIPAGDGKYVQFKAGKLVTLMGVEVIEDVVNPNLSEGNQFIYVENFTNTGLRMDVKPAAQVDFELALINGWDVVQDNNSKKSFMGRIGITPDALTTVALVGYLGNEKAAVGGVTPSGNRYGGNLVVTRKIGSKTTINLQGDYGEEKDLPAVGETAKWWAAGLWAAFDVSPVLNVALRGDYMDDKDGARTSGVLGFPVNTGQKFGSGTVTFNIKRWDSVLIRPEIRYDRSNLLVFPATDGTLRKDELTFALGASYLF